MTTQRPPESTRRLLFAIMFGLLAWGLLIAVGAALFGDSSLKPWLLLGSVLVFVGLWAVLLWFRRRL